MQFTPPTRVLPSSHETSTRRDAEETQHKRRHPPLTQTQCLWTMDTGIPLNEGARRKFKLNIFRLFNKITLRFYIPPSSKRVATERGLTIHLLWVSLTTTTSVLLPHHLVDMEILSSEDFQHVAKHLQGSETTTTSLAKGNINCNLQNQFYNIHPRTHGLRTSKVEGKTFHSSPPLALLILHIGLIQGRLLGKTKRNRFKLPHPH